MYRHILINTCSFDIDMYNKCAVIHGDYLSENLFSIMFQLAIRRKRSIFVKLSDLTIDATLGILEYTRAIYSL